MAEQDPYQDIDEFSDSVEPPQAPEHSSKPGPQPVTSPTNPFTSPRYPSATQDATYTPQAHPQSHQGYYSGVYENPFLTHSGHPHVPATRPFVAPPERQVHLSAHKLNTWLSLFIPIASVIFFFVDKGKEQLYDQHLRETMNMGLTRMIIFGGGAVMTNLIGGFGAIFTLAGIVYFILTLAGALEATQKYVEGSPIRYRGAIPFTRKDD